MKEFLIKNKKRFCIGGAIILVLAFSFWFGGNSPSSKGWATSNGKSEYALAGVGNNENQVSETNNTVGDVTQSPDGQQGSYENNEASQAQGTGNGQSGASGSSIPSSSSTAGSSSSSQSSSNTAGTPGVTPNSSSGGSFSSGTGQSTPSSSNSCTISISCKTILSNMDSLKQNKVSIVPSDGWVLKTVKVEFKDGESVFDVLQTVTQKYKIHMEYSKSPIYDSMYIEGIANLYEFDCGDLSGWMYKVNDAFPDYGCSQYKVEDGDVIDWDYTCDLGNDIGGGYAAGN